MPAPPRRGRHRAVDVYGQAPLSARHSPRAGCARWIPAWPRAHPHYRRAIIMPCTSSGSPQIYGPPGGAGIGRWGLLARLDAKPLRGPSRGRPSKHCPRGGGTPVWPLFVPGHAHADLILVRLLEPHLELVGAVRANPDTLNSRWQSKTGEDEPPRPAYHRFPAVFGTKAGHLGVIGPGIEQRCAPLAFPPCAAPTPFPTHCVAVAVDARLDGVAIRAAARAARNQPGR